jgi:hypothetical protein
MKLLLFGNPALPSDNLAIKVGKGLEKDGHTILQLENPLGLLELDLKEYVILDVAYGIKKVTLIDNVDKLVLGRLCSLHDFDMAYFLKLLRRLGKLEKVRILAIPQRMSAPKALLAVRSLLHNL